MSSPSLRPVLALATAFGAVLAVADDGLYFGASGAAAFYDVDYLKGVDSRDPANITANAGRILFAGDSADDTSRDVALLAGYRLGLGPLLLDIEADITNHDGTANGRLPGAGESPGRNLVGEVWPEEWSLTKDRSYGITARVGVPVPLFGAEVSAFVGMRRLDATFKTTYTGCLIVAGCAPDEYTTGRERHDEEFDAWIAGVAVEKSLGPIGIRGELRYTEHGDSKRTVNFDDVAVTVPVNIESDEIGVGLSLIWRR